jgi:hypothetical protein
MMLELSPEMTFGVLSPALKVVSQILLYRNIKVMDALFILTVYVNYSIQGWNRWNADTAIT